MPSLILISRRIAKMTTACISLIDCTKIGNIMLVFTMYEQEIVFPCDKGHTTALTTCVLQPRTTKCSRSTMSLRILHLPTEPVKRDEVILRSLPEKTLKGLSFADVSQFKLSLVAPAKVDLPDRNPVIRCSLPDLYMCFGVLRGIRFR